MSVIISALWYAAPLLPVKSGSSYTGLRGDRFDPQIGRIRTLAEMERQVPSVLVDTGHRNRDVALALTKLVELHTVHGVARQSWRENWIANVLDMIAPEGVSFAGRMRPEGLVTDNAALCSQANLLLRAFFRRAGIPNANVRFNVGGAPPHSAVAAKPDGVWRYYDPSYEPRDQGVPIGQLLSSDRFLDLYSDQRWRSQGVDRHFLALAKAKKIAITDIDGPGPWRGLAFQLLTRTMSNFGWILPLMFAVILLVRRYAEGWKPQGRAD